MFRVYARGAAIVYGVEAESSAPPPAAGSAKPKRRLYVIARGTRAVTFNRLATTSSVTGTLAKTNANDTVSASGTTTVVGTLARTNANDTVSAGGTTTVTGTLARTNANDTVSASGSVADAVSGTLAYTNANDSVSAAGSPVVSGSLARTNADDTVAASGFAGAVSGTVAVTNANDSVSASGYPGDRPQTTVVTGSLKRWYTVKGKRYYLTNEELAYLLARDMIDAVRDDVKVSYKNKKPHKVSKETWDTLQATVKSLNSLPFFDEDEESAAMLLL